jgi:hypothetical protein
VASIVCVSCSAINRDDLLLTVSMFSLSPKLQKFQTTTLKNMYLVVIAWIYVVLMMSLTEAFSSQGSVLGAVVTFVLYGVLPLSIVVYILGTPARKRALQETESASPDAGSHAAAAAEADSVSPVREKDPRS